MSAIVRRPRLRYPAGLVLRKPVLIAAALAAVVTGGWWQAAGAVTAGPASGRTPARVAVTPAAFSPTSPRGVPDTVMLEDPADYPPGQPPQDDATVRFVNPPNSTAGPITVTALTYTLPTGVQFLPDVLPANCSRTTTTQTCTYAGAALPAGKVIELVVGVQPDPQVAPGTYADGSETLTGTDQHGGPVTLTAPEYAITLGSCIPAAGGLGESDHDSTTADLTTNPQCASTGGGVPEVFGEGEINENPQGGLKINSSVGNPAGAPTTSGHLTVTLPDGLTFDTLGQPAGCTLALLSTQITCPVPDIAGGETYTLALSVTDDNPAALPADTYTFTQTYTPNSPATRGISDPPGYGRDHEGYERDHDRDHYYHHDYDRDY